MSENPEPNLVEGGDGDSGSDSNAAVRSEGRGGAKKKGKKRNLRDEKSGKPKKKRKVEDNWVHVPHIPVPIIFGRRSKKDGEHKNWHCACGTINYATRHVIVDLPAFRCSNKKCRHKPQRINFRFSFGNLTTNGVYVIGSKIYDQRNRSDCEIVALAKGCEIAANLRYALLGVRKHVKPLDPYSFEIDLRKGDKAKVKYGTAKTMQKIRDLLATKGITESGCNNTYRFNLVVVDYDSDSECDNHSDNSFEVMATALADGIPLLAEIVHGKNLYDLKYGKIYKSPESGPFVNVTDSDDSDDEGDSDEGASDDEGEAEVKKKKKKKKVEETHVVVLVGAARTEEVDYFYFVNSWGAKFCVRVKRGSNRKTSGIGKIYAGDVFGKFYKIMPFQML